MALADAEPIVRLGDEPGTLVILELDWSAGRESGGLTTPIVAISGRAALRGATMTAALESLFISASLSLRLSAAGLRDSGCRRGLVVCFGEVVMALLPLLSRFELLLDWLTPLEMLAVRSTRLPLDCAECQMTSLDTTVTLTVFGSFRFSVISLRDAVL